MDRASNKGETSSSMGTGCVSSIGETSSSSSQSTTLSGTAIDISTQNRLLKYWSAHPKAGEVRRDRLSDTDTRTNQAPTAGDGPAPIWSHIARDLLTACTFREFAHAHQTYERARSEYVSVVLIEILKPGYKSGVSWCRPRKLEVLVSLTRCETPGRDPPIESAAHLHVIISNRLHPVLVANLSAAQCPSFAGHNSFLVKCGNRALAEGLSVMPHTGRLGGGFRSRGWML